MINRLADVLAPKGITAELRKVRGDEKGHERLVVNGSKRKKVEFPPKRPQENLAILAEIAMASEATKGGGMSMKEIRDAIRMSGYPTRGLRGWQEERLDTLITKEDR